MKFIPLLLVLGLATANSQITTASGAQVYVSTGTLVYSTGDITVKSGTTKFLNKGNVKIGKLGDATTGTYKADSDVGEDIFVLSYDDVDQYGQLIIESGNAASGNITKQYNLDINNPGGTFAYFGSPFAGYTSANLVSDLTSQVTTTIGDLYQYRCYALKCAPRDYMKYPVLEWSNTNLSFDPSSYTNGEITFTPTKFYLLRKGTTANFPSNIVFTNVNSFTGTPFVSNSSAPDITFQKRAVTIGDNTRNAYRVKYYTYITDPIATAITSFTALTTEAALSSAGFGDYTYQLTNPYTSNLNLKILTNNYANIQGVSSFRSITKGGGAKTRYSGQLLVATVLGAGTSTASLVGDADLEIIPPMTNFELKATASAVGNPIKFDTSNSHKVFDASKYFSATTQPDPVQGVSSNSRSMISAKSVDSESTAYQLNLQLWTTNKDEFLGKTYVVSSPLLTTGELNEVEALNTDISSTITGVYTIPEAPTGGADPNNSNTMLYINGINTEAAKVAIPIGINIASDDSNTSYALIADLREGGKSLSSKSVNFSNPSAKYFIHDKKTGSVTELSQDFTYPVKIEDDEYTTVNKDGSKTVNRYELFWKEIGTMGTDDINSIDGITNVYKSGTEYKIRFNKNWNKADVTVFNVVGQLISSEKNINAQDDYLLPIKGSSSTMYIIKIVNDKGETVTKKIVK